MKIQSCPQFCQTAQKTEKLNSPHLENTTQLHCLNPPRQRPPMAPPRGNGSYNPRVGRLRGRRNAPSRLSPGFKRTYICAFVGLYILVVPDYGCFTQSPVKFHPVTSDLRQRPILPQSLPGSRHVNEGVRPGRVPRTSRCVLNCLSLTKKTR